MHPAGRALLAFWIALLLLVGGGGAVLWWLGAPPAPKLFPPRPSNPPQAPPPVVAGARTPPVPQAAPGSTETASLAVSPPLPALEEPAPGLPGRTLPVIGPDGRMPATAYASHAGLPATGPQIAILLEGLGLSDAVDRQAVDSLPAPISFAVSPYADALDLSGTPPLLGRARRNGHELWLSVPMEPAGSPADTEGAHALSLNVDFAKDREWLIWCLSRFPGYVGLTNALGGLRGDRFASSSAFDMVANAVRQRGLAYVDAGLAPHDQPAIVPPRTRHADLSIDDSPDASDIQARLSRLEQLAQQNGSALGIAGPLRPVTIERLRNWSRTLHEHGITLVPVSALPPPHPAPADLPGAAPGSVGTVQTSPIAGAPAPSNAMPASPAPATAPVVRPPDPAAVRTETLAPVAAQPTGRPAPAEQPARSAATAPAVSDRPDASAPSRTTPPERHP